MRVAGRALAVILCVAGLPALVIALVYAFYGAPVSSYGPTINDEVAYWHQASTFVRAGFNGGYYTFDEATNPSGFTPFGPHGPGFIVFYGLFGKVFGWHRDTVVMLNLLALSAAGLVWVLLSRVSTPRLLLSGVLLVTFWHVVFWAPTGMQESLHHAAAIVLAACFASALEPTPKRWITPAGWIVLGVLSFIRPSWIILMPIWAIVTSRGSKPSVMWTTVAASLVYGAAILFAYGSMTAPYDSGFLFLRAASLTTGAREIAQNVASNVRRLGMLDEFHPIELLERYEYGAVVLIAAIGAVIARRKAQSAPHLTIAAVTMALAFAAMLVLYQFTNYAEHRVLSAFLLLGTLLCVASPGRLGPLLAAGIILTNVVSARRSLADFEDGWRNHFVWDQRETRELEQALGRRVVYQPGASRWCNTLLTSLYPPQLIAIPAGIGLSYLRKPEKIPHPRSHYMLLDDGMRHAFNPPLQLEPIATLPYATIYVNRESGCE